MLVRTVFLICGAVLGMTVLLVFAMIIAFPAADMLREIYGSFPETSNPRYTAFLTASGTIVAFISVIAAIATFAISSAAARRAQRKQHTITVLLDTRLSSEFQQTIERRRLRFPEYSDVTFEAWDAARKAVPANPSDPTQVAEAKLTRDSALALTQLLNYYEFLAVGILDGDLDEPMLYKTIRSIMCNLVDDCRLLIAGMQEIKPSTYEHLTALYERWRKTGALDINRDKNERPIPR